MSKVIGVTVGTNTNPNKFNPSKEEFEKLKEDFELSKPYIVKLYTVESYEEIVNLHTILGLDEVVVINVGEAFEIPIVRRYASNGLFEHGAIMHLKFVGEDGEIYVNVLQTIANVPVENNAGHLMMYAIDDGEGNISEHSVLALQRGGKDGESITITNIKESTAANGTSVVTFSDGQTLSIKNGRNGASGNTPVKGVDYFTPTEIDEIVNDAAKDAAELVVETDPTVPSWAKQSSKPTYSASEVGADVSGTAILRVAEHNTKTDAHNDIRLLIAGLTERLNALADSDDSTLDQMSEIVAYIKANKSLIDSITDTKVNVADIINNLTTNVSNKPLSASQGVVLKGLIDAITIPTKVSAFTNDAGYLTSFTESDPTVPSWAKASSKPSYTKSEVGLSNVDNVKQYSASNPPPYPVTSVNGKTGAVTITVPTKTSELTNNSGFLTSHQDISGKADKSSAETWTFTLKSGSTVTKKVVLA